jgi:hypothetical protein
MNLEAHAFASEGLLCPTWTCSFSSQLNFKCDYDHRIDVLQQLFLWQMKCQIEDLSHFFCFFVLPRSKI